MNKINDIDNMTQEELENIYIECIQYAKLIKNDDLRNCCLEIYSDYKERLMNKPATGGDCHHFYKGGLLFHTYCVTRNAITISKMYDYVDLDIDLIIFGALLHDIGKANEYNDYDTIVSTNNIYVSNGANLLGHSYEGAEIVSRYLDKYKLKSEFKLQVLHMIGCHMNEFSEWGSLTSSKMLEVLIINFGDAMDAEIENFRFGINSAKEGEIYHDLANTTKFYKSLNPVNKSKENVE